jgi:hypothetical protein
MTVKPVASKSIEHTQTLCEQCRYNRKERQIKLLANCKTLFEVKSASAQSAALR